jgi:hypothetical protein
LTAGEQVILEGLTKVEPDMVVVPKPAKEPSEAAPAAGQGG